MGSLLFIKIEIIILILSLLYIFYFLSARFFVFFFKIRKVIKPTKIKSIKTALNKINLNKKEIDLKKDTNNLTESDKIKLINLIKRVKINSSKGYYDLAKNLIVEGLSLDKYNRDLNIELALIYEKEKNFSNAEYIYKDLLSILKNDFELMKKLGFVYALQNKLKESFDIYESVYNKKKSDEEVVEILADISFNMKLYKKSLKYLKLFLLIKTRDIDKMFMKCTCLEELGKEKETLIIYKRILDLQPYNTKAKDRLDNLKK